jgi:hypothetical protein
MNKVRIALAGIAIVALGAGVSVTTAASVSAADKPLKVKILTVDGKKRLKVKRKLAVAVGCTKNCAVVVNMKLVMPHEVLKATVKGGIKAYTAKSPSMILNRAALNYLKLTWPRSRFAIKVTATDISNGKKTVKKKVFRFRR